jgi:hypothetical protein
VKLKIKAEAFDYKNLPTPQADTYKRWIKKQLVAGHPIAWMIMLGSESRPPHYPVYPGLPYGFYSHVEPVFGYYSDHPLEDPDWHPGDYIEHASNGSPHPYYREVDKLTDNLNFTGNCAVSGYPGDPCVYEEYGFAWAFQDVLDSTHPDDGMALSLAMDQDAEPDTRRGQAPVSLFGTVTVTGLTPGKKYVLYRWDSVDTAFNYELASHIDFTADGATFAHKDTRAIISNQVAYYRCLAA